MNDFNAISAVIVTYQPNIQALENLLDAIKDQVNSVVIVDNGSNSSISRWYGEGEFAGIHFIPL